MRCKYLFSVYLTYQSTFGAGTCFKRSVFDVDKPIVSIDNVAEERFDEEGLAPLCPVDPDEEWHSCAVIAAVEVHLR